VKVFVCIIVCLQLLACVSKAKYIPLYHDELQPCVQLLLNFKHQVKQQRVDDAQLLWTNTYPHLAFDRFSLSLINQLHSHSARGQWLSYVSQQADKQRTIEYQNLPDKREFELPALAACAEQLAFANLSDQHFWQNLQRDPPVYDSDYQQWQRVLGLYPVTKLIARPIIDNEKNRIRNGFKQTVANKPRAYAPLFRASLSAQEIQNQFKYAYAASDLSWPQLSEEQWSNLLSFYAPNWIIETATNDDKPGRIEFAGNGNAWVNPRQSVLYVFTSYTRFHGQILTQLNYNLWFANRTAKSSFDPYAGKFDSILIRLTLNKHGQPYILDSIHSCGCYHMVFSLDPSLTFAPVDATVEAPITMHLANKSPDNPPLTVLLSSGDHMIKGLHWDGLDKYIPLSLLPYDQLRSLPFKPTYQRSLFDNAGMLRASKRAERWFLWPFGVKSAGAMRQIGHHATAFIGQRHFDDAFMLEHLFLAQ
jgi:hypothetical protein